MTKKETLLAYVYQFQTGVFSKQLRIAFALDNYSLIRREIRTLLNLGYLDTIRKNKMTAYTITKAGIRYLTQKQDISSLTALREGSYGKVKQERLLRVTQARDLCHAAGITTAQSVGISFSDLINKNTVLNAPAFDAHYKTGILFSSNDVLTAIGEMGYGEEITINRSRFVGVIVNRNGMWVLYNTAARLMRWFAGTEEVFVTSLSETMRRSATVRENPEKYWYVESKPKAIVIGTGDSMIPKVYTGRKWGELQTDTPAKQEVAKHLISHSNLSTLFARSFFVPNTLAGVDILYNTVCVSQGEREAACKRLLREQGYTRYNTDRNQVWGEAPDTEERASVMPVVEFDGLAYFKTTRDFPVVIMCAAGVSEGISRVLGTKLIKAIDYDGTPHPVEHYSDTGELLSSSNPLIQYNQKRKEMRAAEKEAGKNRKTQENPKGGDLLCGKKSQKRDTPSTSALRI